MMIWWLFFILVTWWANNREIVKWPAKQWLQWVGFMITASQDFFHCKLHEVSRSKKHPTIGWIGDNPSVVVILQLRELLGDVSFSVLFLLLWWSLMWGQSAMDDVHPMRDRCHTVPFSGSKRHWDPSALHMFVPNHDLSHWSHYVWNWTLVPITSNYQFQLNPRLGWLVAQRDLQGFNIASTLPTFIELNILLLHFHHSAGSPVAQHVHTVMACDTFAGCPRCCDAN